MSLRSDGSPAPSVSQEIFSMRHEILEDESYSDFSSDDEGNDPNFVPNSKSTLRVSMNPRIKLFRQLLQILPKSCDYHRITAAHGALSLKLQGNESEFLNCGSRMYGKIFVTVVCHLPTKAEIKDLVEQWDRLATFLISTPAIYIYLKRQIIHSYFWSLTSGEKKIFYGNFVKREAVKRRKTSFHFFFMAGDKTFQVYKKYFLSTLAISERTIYYFFAKHYAIDTVKVGFKNEKLGRNPTDESQVMEVKNHIPNFPTIESHYCRASTSRKYLEAHLSVQKMYDLYKTAVNNPVGIYTYRKIFNTCFNLSFYIPRKDICDRCQLFKVNAPKNSEAEVQLHEKHLEEKRFTTAERDVDLQSIDTNAAVLMYDLENVFTLPKMFASSFYYKRKLCVYNLTGTLIIPGQEKITYCDLWNETLSGRSGNDIANGLIKILSKAVNCHSNLIKFTLWSDSCVPQNRNKISSTAILQFMHDHPQIQEIVQKFNEPGHSSLQQLDSVHNTIEKFLRKVEIPSQLCLIRLLKNAQFPNVQLQLLQMNDIDFKRFSIKAESLIFKNVQFFKCKSIKYSNNDYFKVGTKLSIKELEYYFFDVKKNKGRFSTKIWKHNLRAVPKKPLDNNKKKDLQSCLPFIEKEEDRNFYRAILNL